MALDAMRTLAILGMMATHTTRLIPSSARWEINRWAMLLEPLIPSLFLALVGASLVLSRRGLARIADGPPIPTWTGRQFRRALGLWIIAVVFYCIEDGWHWPDAVAAPGILGTIAYAIILLTCLLALPHSFFAIGFVLVLGVAAYQSLDGRGLSVFWLTQGNSPMFPLLLFALGGACYAQAGLLWPAALKKVGGRMPGTLAHYLVLAMALGAAAWAITRFGIEPLFTKPLGRSDATRILTSMRDGQERTQAMGYYNLRPILSLTVLALLVALHQFFALISGMMRPVSPWLFAMGRHGLGVYILHLALLAVAVVTLGKRPFPQAWMGMAAYLALLVICQGYALWRERGKS